MYTLFSKVLPLLLITIIIVIIMPLYSTSMCFSLCASVTKFPLSATVVFKQKAITRKFGSRNFKKQFQTTQTGKLFYLVS